MEAIEQVVVCQAAKAVRKHSKSRKQRLGEEPNCPVCLENLTNETLSKPVKCHNICVDCLPLCKKCPLCRNEWATKKQLRKKCESAGCDKMTERICMGLTIGEGLAFPCSNHVCGRCKGRCVTCNDRVRQLVTVLLNRHLGVELEGFRL